MSATVAQLPKCRICGVADVSMNYTKCDIVYYRSVCNGCRDRAYKVGKRVSEIQEPLAVHTCIDCGETYPFPCDAHHTTRTDVVMLCPNCHRYRHWMEQQLDGVAAHSL